MILPHLLGRDIDHAMTAQAAPHRQGQVSPLGDWKQVALINVAVELGQRDRSLGRHSDSLQESRNLIHPDRQIKSASAAFQTETL